MEFCCSCNTAYPRNMVCFRCIIVIVYIKIITMNNNNNDNNTLPVWIVSRIWKFPRGVGHTCMLTAEDCPSSKSAFSRHISDICRIILTLAKVLRLAANRNVNKIIRCQRQRCTCALYIVLWGVMVWLRAFLTPALVDGGGRSASLEEAPMVYIEYEAGWAPRWTLDVSERRRISSPEPRFFGRLTLGLVNVLTELFPFLFRGSKQKKF